MAGLTIAERVLDELGRARRPLDDDELARRLGVQPRQSINQVCRKLARSGCLRRYRGPEGKIVNDLSQAATPVRLSDTHSALSAVRTANRDSMASAVRVGGAAAWPGHPVSVAELVSAGFLPLELRVTSMDLVVPRGMGCEWTTVGEVPDGPGLYAFTVEDEHQMRVAYVGRTVHLWMITKGRLPAGDARGGQRYGKPRHAGETRQRINVLIAEQLRVGRLVRHWACPRPQAALPLEEEQFITGWNLRLVGWNRG